MNNFDLQRRIKKVPVKDKKGKKRNLVFSGLLLLAISFSIVTVIGAATPDPGHSFAELDLTGILIGPTEGGTGLTTIGLPDQVLGVNLAGTGLEYKTIDKTFIGLPNVEDTALSTWHGTSNISTLGTITSGIWNANPIGDTHISSAGTWNAKQNALGFTPENSSNKGIPGGYAELDGSGAIPTSQIPVSILGKVEYKGTWDANTNVPDLVLGTSVKGDYYIVSVTGVTSLGGITDWQIGDWAIYDGTTWGKVENTDSVTSVNGGTGAIIVDPTSLGLVIGTDVQAWDADLDSWSAIAPASVDKSYVGLGNVEDTALSAWAGTANLTTLGTITTGVWNGTVIDDTYISSSATWNAKGLVLGSTYGATFASGTNYVSFLGLSTSNATLINRQFIVPISGTLKNFYIRTITAEPVSGS